MKKAKAVVKKEVKAPKKKTDVGEMIGNLLLDFSKLTFGSFILGGVLRGELPQVIIIFAGLAGTVVFALFGILFLRKKLDKE